MPNALHCGEKLRLLEALGDELSAISRAINLEQTLAAKWGRNAFGQAEASPVCSYWDISHKFELCGSAVPLDRKDSKSFTDVTLNAELG